MDFLWILYIEYNLKVKVYITHNLCNFILANEYNICKENEWLHLSTINSLV